VSTCNVEASERRMIPNLVKIDVEGFEIEVLKGADHLLLQNEKNTCWVVEVSNGRVNSGGGGMEIMQLFSRHNFKAFVNSAGKESNSSLIPLSESGWSKLKHDNVYFYKEDKVE
ncbi:MAG: FkbM family methyltransferase, partial [Bacteroidetes bacterium]|nr:FkbM family methyltransferase [Bacteroidota bacterium]